MNDNTERGNVDCVDCDFSKQRNGCLMCDRCCDDDSGGDPKNDYDRCKWGRPKEAHLCGLSVEVRMNKATHDKLIAECGSVLLVAGARFLEGVRVVIDNDLPWNVSEWVREHGQTVISRERVMVFLPDPLRHLWQSRGA